MSETPGGRSRPRTSTAGAGEGADAARESAAGIWDAEWSSAWKAHPANPWLTYEAGVYVDPLGVSHLERPVRAQDGCVRRGMWPRNVDGRLGPHLVCADVSPRIVRHASHALGGGVIACAADVRALPCLSSTFDLVLSTSTLDHFDERGEITVALTELARVLRTDGRLFVTLDNPANPLLRIRQLVYALTGALGGLDPVSHGLGYRPSTGDDH